MPPPRGAGGRWSRPAAGPCVLSHVLDRSGGDPPREGAFLHPAREASGLVSGPLGCLPPGFPLRAEAAAAAAGVWVRGRDCVGDRISSKLPGGARTAGSPGLLPSAGTAPALPRARVLGCTPAPACPRLRGLVRRCRRAPAVPVLVSPTPSREVLRCISRDRSVCLGTWHRATCAPTGLSSWRGDRTEGGLTLADSGVAR